MRETRKEELLVYANGEERYNHILGKAGVSSRNKKKNWREDLPGGRG
jgi:hypothetical protein